MGRGPSPPQVLLLDAAPDRTARIAALLAARGIHATQMAVSAPAGPGAMPARTSVALLSVDPEHPPDPASGGNELAALLKSLDEQHVATLVWGAAPRAFGSGNLCAYLPPAASAEEVVGRLSSVSDYAPLVKQLEAELRRMERVARQVGRHFEEIDKEMRLAGRLQQDFLPRSFPEVPPLQFAHLYRPATWVSGDLFDVFRVDEDHVGLFIADAMGHGTSAALMTMFMRKALVTKRVGPGGHEVVPPAEVIKLLNDGMVALALPNTQLMTAAYVLFNLRTNELRAARGGHPFPIIARHDGRIEEMKPGGGLLGLADLPSEFDEERTRLEPGDKVILYTDGLENILIQSRSEDEPTVFHPDLGAWAAGDAAGVVGRVAEHLDHLEGSLNPDDDITLLVLGVERRPAT